MLTNMSRHNIAMLTMQRYLNLVRRLIKTYTLEPAGSHGVWGLDDHAFLPYIFGSAQLGPVLQEHTPAPTEGSLPDAPETGDIMKTYVVERERDKNMYFAAVGFIYDVKTGPFWEHSPMLYDISGVSEGWAKINKVSSRFQRNVSQRAGVPIARLFHCIILGLSVILGR